MSSHSLNDVIPFKAGGLRQVKADAEVQRQTPFIFLAEKKWND